MQSRAFDDVSIRVCGLFSPVVSPEDQAKQRCPMNHRQRQARSFAFAKRHRGMTVVEIIAVVGIIILLLAILLPALGVASGNAEWAKSQSNMKQVFQLMQEYSNDHRETIVPAAFDYSGSSYTGKARSAQPAGAAPPLTSTYGSRVNYGTWSDILWTYGKFGEPFKVESGLGAGGWNYRYDSPDRVYYSKDRGYESIFRSSVEMTEAAGGTDALPFGDGSQLTEIGHKGYFAANLLFDARPGPENNFGDWRTTAEVRRNDRTVYLVDSFHGEVIEPTVIGFGSPEDPVTPVDGQVDFRYPGETALMLFMDGHIQTEGKWELFDDLKSLRGFQVDSLR